MTQYKNILGHKDKAIHMAQLKTEHLSGLEFVKEYADYLDEVYAYGGGAGPNGSAIDMLKEYGITVVKICE